MIKKTGAIALTILAIFWGSASGQQLSVDDAHAEIRFDVQHIYALTSGRFSGFAGDIFFAPQNLGNSRFDFSVKVKTITTFNNKRDKHLLSKDFFDADSYPEMRFVSEKIIHLGDSRYAVEGKLTIKDVSRPQRVEFDFYGPKPHPFDKKKKVFGFTGKFSINRLDYNVGDGKFAKMGVVGETVNISVSFEALGN